MRKIPASLLAVVSMLLASCATSSQWSNDNCSHVDCQKMAVVEREALLSGITVLWVNPPEKLTR